MSSSSPSSSIARSISSWILATCREATCSKRATSVCSSMVRILPTTRRPASDAILPYYAWVSWRLLARADFDAVHRASHIDHFVVTGGKVVLCVRRLHQLVAWTQHLAGAVAECACEDHVDLFAAVHVPRERTAGIDTYE